MKVKLSLAAMAAMTTISFGAGLELYEDIATKQIFTTPGENRQKLGSFVQENNLAEMMAKEVKSTPVKSKAQSIEIGGTSYLGFTSNQFRDQSTAGVYDATSKGAKSNGGFEIRRTYLDIKGNLGGGDLVRVTTDVTKEVDAVTGTTAAAIKLKYAYLWLNSIPFIPNTGVEMGMVHRAWIDYEENNGWYWRSINKVLVEDKMSIAPNGATNYAAGTSIENSADMGVNFRTKTDYFTSEFAILNGEGYDSTNSINTTKSTALDFEYRITGALMGDGKHTGHRNVNKDTYADISLTGIMSYDHATTDLSSTSRYDRKGNWIHAVYNMPYFLIAGQAGKVTDKGHDGAAGKDQEYSIYSINADIRPTDKWTIIGRYDSFSTKYNLAADSAKNDNKAGDAAQYILGVAYGYSKNVNLIANYKRVDSKDTTASGVSTIGNTLDKSSMMLTAEVKW
jgi:hypothetical protein